MARLLTWIPADGSESITLNERAAGYRVMAEATTGLWSPPYRTSEDTYAGQDGTTLTALDADKRTVTLGLQIEGATETELRARWRRLVRAMRPKAGDGVLQAADEFGVTYSLTCRYTGGLEGDGQAMFAGTLARAVVKLDAYDPWWYGEGQTVTLSLGAPSVFFPFFPLRLSPSTVQGQFVIDLSDSDAPTFPLWTVKGPGDGLVLTNESTGQVIQINAPLTSGQSMTIDTRQGFQSVRRNDGTNLMGFVSSDPALWALVEGVNTVTAALTGATAASRITGIYAPRYASI
jgi:hypothetical protein